jgi:hypothetical protein
MDAVGAETALVVAAIPEAGRTTVGGRQLVDGVPVDETAFARDPQNPVHDARVAVVIEATSRRRARSAPLGDDAPARSRAVARRREHRRRRRRDRTTTSGGGSSRRETPASGCSSAHRARARWRATCAEASAASGRDAVRRAAGGVLSCPAARTRRPRRSSRTWPPSAALP